MLLTSTSSVHIKSTLNFFKGDGSSTNLPTATSTQSASPSAAPGNFRVGRMFLYPDHTHDYRKELNLTQKGLRIVIDLSVWHIKL